ncbi:phosphotransferase [Nocardiopsis exhalans]|uniref:Phosphotransferase n=1 Tax=Nocardiopsis exhalans TaxID=163604 RepID=A0ABY5D0Y0_9ACTN|nr:phosphotransferase [Nocardiopsis exhalans]USY17986.1 phosphotransferase [Nocardiopsis exhalans]
MTPDVSSDSALVSAWQDAAAALDLTVPSPGELHHGVGGRTVSGPVTRPEGHVAWLRVESAPKPAGRLWEGNRLAEEILPARIPRPRLLAAHTWGTGPVFQALVFSRVDAAPVSSTPDLRGPLTVDSTWWTALRRTLRALHHVKAPQQRRSHTPGYIERIPTYLPEVVEAGVDLTVRTWATAHADLHWANLTHNPLVLMDWEGWGAAPAGYDAAVLHAYALPVPDTAARVRAAFADVLDTEDGRLAELIICAEIIQAAPRDDLHARLAPYARAHARHLLCT